MIGEKSTGDVLFTGPAKNQQPGKKGDPVKPKFLLGDALAEPALPEGFKEPKLENNKPPPAPQFSRKDQFADWVTGESNPFIAKAIANRIWAQHFGRGLVHPVDNMSPSNKPSHPELLTALTAWLVEHKFDLKAYIRELVNSRTYQLSSRLVDEPVNRREGHAASDTAGVDAGVNRRVHAALEAQPIWFQHARSRPLSAEELIESWRVATGYDLATKDKQKEKKPSRFRPLADGYMVRFFGQPNNGVGEFQGGLAEHLYLNNGPMSNLIATGEGSLFTAVAKADQPWPDRIDRLFLQTLNRPSSSDEREKLAALIGGDEERLRDAIWALLTCSEFRFNH
jgi:hypothetical protein